MMNLTQELATSIIIYVCLRASHPASYLSTLLDGPTSLNFGYYPFVLFENRLYLSHTYVRS